MTLDRPAAESAAADRGYDEPTELARLVATAPRPLLIGLDVDGVLAPIVDHPDHAAIPPGVHGSIRALTRVAAVHVAVVSGRSIEDLARFGFAGSTLLVGSHGMELEGRGIHPLDPVETLRLLTLDQLASSAALEAGEGAWVERKPASVVLHVRQADPGPSRAAMDGLLHHASTIEGATVKRGSGVLELFARSASKGDALVQLAADVGTSTTVFVGDDLTDEDAFAALGARDITVKVGDADTLARHRLADPAAVATWLEQLISRL